MPKAILEFNLPEEAEEYQITTDASAMHSAIWDFMAEIRKKRKYGEEEDRTFDSLADLAHELFGGFTE